jgi:hypothetical protein
MRSVINDRVSTSAGEKLLDAFDPAPARRGFNNQFAIAECRAVRYKLPIEIHHQSASATPSSPRNKACFSSLLFSSFSLPTYLKHLGSVQAAFASS